jgi:hypothetical protein
MALYGTVAPFLGTWIGHLIFHVELSPSPTVAPYFIHKMLGMNPINKNMVI